jgi:hypothetical protein
VGTTSPSSSQLLLWALAQHLWSEKTSKCGQDQFTTLSSLLCLIFTYTHRKHYHLKSKGFCKKK